MLENLIKLYNAGKSYEEISHSCGKSKKWVMLKLRGHIIPRAKKRKPVVCEIIEWETNSDRDNQIINLYKEGIGAFTVAKMLNISKEAVYRILKTHKIKIDKNRSYSKLKNNDIIKINELYKSGKSTTEISQIYKVSEGTITYHLLNKRSPAETNSKIPIHLFNAVIKWYADNNSSYDISELLLSEHKLKIHPNCIQNFLRRQGIIRSNTDAKKIAATKRAVKITRSKPERDLEQIIKEFTADCTPQFVLDGWIFDYKCGNVLIEVQGDYWHKLPGRPNRDTKKAEVAQKYGYKLIYIHEHEFERPDLIRNRIKNAIAPMQPFDFTNCDIREISWQDAKKFLDTYHYQKSGRAGIKVGAYYNGVLIAVAVFCPPVRLESAKKQGLQYNEISELSRLCIHPEYQCKNLATWFIAKARKIQLKVKPTTKVLIAFSDTTYAHYGTIYKADNWHLDGETDNGYWYIKNRSIVHKKTVWNAAKKLKITEKQMAIQMGLKKVKSMPKLRWIYRH